MSIKLRGAHFGTYDHSDYTVQYIFEYIYIYIDEMLIDSAKEKI